MVNEKAFKIGFYTGVALSFVLVLTTSAMAGTGGSYFSSWWSEIAAWFTGYPGKIGSAFFMLMAIIAAKNGSIGGAAFLFLLGLSLGFIPGAIDSAYTGTF
ncbi:hypothetical protein [Desulfurobacterium sp. TC5-1]|uniref:hypothetical protein n=1 Tax=Desulfurobacterium sp. TC5-1 TaxID=1158318 RepID=UPI0003B2E20A|nr:hypothetical protein [Desulfurobacterium sp. TC5-1]